MTQTLQAPSLSRARRRPATNANPNPNFMSNDLLRHKGNTFNSSTNYPSRLLRSPSHLSSSLQTFHCEVQRIVPATLSIHPSH
mmetsp:Transcript_982/g.1541  ORF Transcript_982/g.1541 Transcript_982/m.1541 type:complete len:83 (+) Transcript_982:69-317(+)